MSRILDKSFVYVPAAETDLRKTFKRERERLKREAKERAAVSAEAKSKVAKRGIRT